MLSSRVNIISHSWMYHCSRHYATLSHKLESNRGFREKGDTPGTEAIFNQELKKMKGVVGQGLNQAFEDDTIQQQETLQKVTKDYSKRSSAMKYAKRAKYLGIDREKRLLTWDNIDKIRYLRQEHPEEWSISQLAASFEVSEMAIKKVLKSKYTPDSKTRKLQDMLVLHNTGREKNVNSSVETSIVLNDQDIGSSVFSQNNINDEQSSPTGDTSNVINHQEKQVTDIPLMIKRKEKISRIDEQSSAGDDEWEEMTDYNLEDELEEADAFSAITASDFMKVSEEGLCPPKIIQKGREFYDTDGEFLFKI